MLVVHLTDRLHHGAAHQEPVAQWLAAKVKVAVLQADALVNRSVRLIDIERGCLGLREDSYRVSRHLDRPCGELLVLGSGATWSDNPLNGDHPLNPRIHQRCMRLWSAGRVNHHLHDAVSIAKINKDEAAVIAATVDPAGETDTTLSIARAQRAADVAAKASCEQSLLSHHSPVLSLQ